MQRLSYLDGLRSFAMSFGLLVHAGVLSRGLSHEMIAFTSGRFRMATFFAISGFFTAMMIQKRGAGAFLRWRLPVLLVPLAVGLVLLNPITHYLIHLYNGGTGGFLDVMLGRIEPRVSPLQNWHLHLWFIISLSFYIVCAPTALRTISARRITRAIARLATHPTLVVGFLAVVFAAYEIAVRGALSISLGAVGFESDLFLVRATLAYMPYFLLGIAMFAVPAMFEAMHQYCWWALGVGFGLGILLAVHPEADPSMAARIAEITSRAVATVASIAALLLLFRTIIRSGNRPAEFLNRSIYSVYMVHYLIIYLLGLTVFASVSNHVLLTFGVAAMTFVIGTLFHFGIVERVPALEFLLNGRTKPRRATKIATG